MNAHGQTAALSQTLESGGLGGAWHIMFKSPPRDCAEHLPRGLQFPPAVSIPPALPSTSSPSLFWGVHPLSLIIGMKPELSLKELFSLLGTRLRVMSHFRKTPVFRAGDVRHTGGIKMVGRF